MKHIIFLLLMLVSISSVSATVTGGTVTIEAGVNFTTTNSTYQVINNLVFDNFSISTDSFTFNNHIITFIPASPLVTNIISLSNSTNSFYTSTSGATINFNITKNGYDSIISYDGNYYSTPLTLINSVYWEYFSTATSNFNFYDQSNSALIDFETITLELISDDVTYVLNTTNGYLSASIADGDYTARFYSDSYQLRTMYLSIVGGESFDLYMINSSVYDQIIVTVLNQIGETVDGAVVKALKYNISTNSYVLQESGITNSDGQVYMSLTKNDDYYKFIVQYNGLTVLTTSPDYIRSDTIELNVLLGAVVGADYDRWKNIDYEITYNDITNNFRLTYNNLASGVTNICLYVYRTTSVADTFIGSSCSNANAATLLYSVTPVNGTNYVGKAYYFVDSNKTLLGSISKGWDVTSNAGNLGGLIQIFLTIIFVIVGIWSLSVGSVLVPLSLIVGRIIGLNNIDYSVLITICVVGVIIAFIVGRRDY